MYINDWPDFRDISPTRIYEYAMKNFPDTTALSPPPLRTSATAGHQKYHT